VDIVALSVGGGAPAVDLSDGLIEAGAASVEPWATAASAAAVDEVIRNIRDRRLVVATDLAGLQLVLNRLLRAGLLASAETAVVTSARIPYLRRVGLPAGRDRQLECAVRGTARLIGVVKDDSGGICVDHACLVPAPPDSGTGGFGSWWIRAVVDDDRLADGNARALTMVRTGPSELRATVRTGRVRQRTITGRSLQLACDPAMIDQDGVIRERPRSKRTFWSEPDAWSLAL
jgi:hypothetical protein